MVKRLIICLLFAGMFYCATVNAGDKLEYKINKFPEAHTIEVITNKYWGKETPMRREKCEKMSIPYLLYKVNGVDTIYLFGYEIYLELGEIFDIDEVEKKVKMIMEANKGIVEISCVCGCSCCCK